MAGSGTQPAPAPAARPSLDPRAVRGTLALDRLAVLVLDEADEMLDIGFAEDIDAILEATPPERQTALFSATLLHEPISSRKWLGVAVTVAGIAILVGFQPQMDARMAFGDLLALVSAITFGLYSVAGRSQRARYGLFTYTGAVYGLASLKRLTAYSSSQS